MAVDVEMAERLLAEHDADLSRDGRLGLVKRYLDGDHDKPYAPRGARREYVQLAEKSLTNWMPSVPDTFTQGLIVTGYRPARQADNAAAWDYWQANGLDARQTITTRGALAYGASYVLVLPSTGPAPVIRPLSPLRSAAWYEDDDDEWPTFGLRLAGQTMAGDTRFEVFDAHDVSTYVRTDTGTHLTGVRPHGFSFVPFVRFRERLDGESQGVVRPLKAVQDRINEVVFATMIALQYASFRQRWATGLAIPEDENGMPVEPFEAAVDRLWVSDNPDARFGDFAQTEMSGHLNMYDATVATFAAMANINPSLLTGSDLINVSAEAMAQMEKRTQRKRREYEVIFGEGWEQVFRLAALAAGDPVGAADRSAQVRWADVESASLAATVDALGKMATMLQVPVEALWEQVPGITDQDLELWRAKRSADPLAVLAAEFAASGDTAAADAASTLAPEEAA